MLPFLKPLPTHVRALIDEESTKAIQQAVWIHVLKSLLDVPDDDNPIALSLVNQNGICSFNNLLVLSSNEIDALSSIPFGIIGRIRVLISLYNDWTCTLGAPIDMRTVTYEDYIGYGLSSFYIEQPLGFFQQQRELLFPVVTCHQVFESLPINDTTNNPMPINSSTTDTPTTDAMQALRVQPTKHNDHLLLQVPTAVKYSDYLPPRVPTMGSTPPAVNPEPAYITAVFEVGWSLRKFKAQSVFSCGTMGSDTRNVATKLKAVSTNLATDNLFLHRSYAGTTFTFDDDNPRSFVNAFLNLQQTTFTFDDDNPRSFVNALINLQQTTFTFDDDNPLHFANAKFNLQPTSIAKRSTSTSHAYNWGATKSNNHATFKLIIDNNMHHETGESSTLDGLSMGSTTLVAFRNILFRDMVHASSSCGAKGSEKFLLLRRFGTPLLGIGFTVCPSTVSRLDSNVGLSRFESIRFEQ